jgi:hypothetical protein
MKNKLTVYCSQCGKILEHNKKSLQHKCSTIRKLLYVKDFSFPIILLMIYVGIQLRLMGIIYNEFVTIMIYIIAWIFVFSLQHVWDFILVRK